MTTVETIDFDAVFAEITARQELEKERRILPPLIRLWDGDWNLRGICKKEMSAEFQFLDNETGIGTLEMPLDYFLSKWMNDVKARSTTNIHITVDKDGARWGGRMEELRVIKDEHGKKFIRATFKHDFEELKHILAWSNPFLPTEVQFPKVWALYGRSRWVCKTTLLCNLIRLEASLWMLPDNPLDIGGWFNFNQSTWSQVVKPDLEPDNSVRALIVSRFKTMFDATKDIVDDAQLSWECRRFLPGDEQPWDGANLRYGCLVWDLIDKSAWNTGTSFGGDLFNGLVHELLTIGSDGVTQTSEVVADPNVPVQYKTPGFKGSVPSAPGVIFRESEHTGIQSSEVVWKPATDVGIVAGGSSMPGVNELISATVQMTGDLTAMIPGVPPLGGVADAILKPLYENVFLAFGKHKNIARAQRLGWSHYHEAWADGADKAYTLSWLLAMRAGMWKTREYLSHTLVVADGAPWRIGQRGHGHFFLGDRIGSTILGQPPGQIWVDRVSELVLSWDRTTTPSWSITVGQREPKDPIAEAFEKMQAILTMLRDLGVL